MLLVRITTVGITSEMAELLLLYNTTNRQPEGNYTLFKLLRSKIILQWFFFQF